MAEGYYRFTQTFTRDSGVAEDEAVVDLHFALVSGTDLATFADLGYIDESLTGLHAADDDDFLNWQETWNPFLASMQAYTSDNTMMDRTIAHRVDSGAPTPNPAVYTEIVGDAGVGTTANAPQIAATCTLATALRRRWGRFYWPQLSYEDTVDPSVGRFQADFVNAFGGALRNACDSWAADGWYLYVQVNEPAGTLLGEGHTVRQIRVDNVADVIRRRRWDRSSGTYISDLD